MMNIIKKFFATILVLGICFATINTKAFAYSNIPDYFDFSDNVLYLNAGSTCDVGLRSTYKYTCYIGNHTSSRTYINYSGKNGTEFVSLHIGPDETEQNLFFYFYVDDDAVADKGIYDTIQVCVQNIDYNYARRADMAAPLKWYDNNNREFNAYSYYMNYEDLREAFGVDGDALFNHYYTVGRFEKRVAGRLIY